jgi:hypothetical protein
MYRVWKFMNLGKEKGKWQQGRGRSSPYII